MIWNNQRLLHLEVLPNTSLEPTRYAHRTHDVVGLFVVLVNAGCLACDRARLMLTVGRRHWLLIGQNGKSD